MLTRIMIFLTTIFMGGFASGMLAGLHIEERKRNMKLNRIKIKNYYTEPGQKKMEKRWEYYRENGVLHSKILIDKNNFLVDGYTSYVIAKAEGMKEVEVVRV